MSNIIKLLPESLANQIAAGEVVQRPASVVKELLENAIDAGATEIKLLVKEAGKTYIQVSDNGTGMSETDARMCFERHATSKIKKSADLFAIKTMGFRGEALASIAAVAQVELKTRRPTDDTGTHLKIEASTIKQVQQCATQSGAVFTIKNLFYNVPARRNFLKSHHVEFKHILDEFYRVALSCPHVQFTLIHNEEEVHVLHTGKLASRIYSLLGNVYKSNILPCMEETDSVKITGYIGTPQVAKKSRGDQYFFVNGRFIKHPYFHHAVTEAYKDIIDEDAFPFYIIFMEMDPIHVDINVHPTKTEVKFDDEHTLFRIITSTVRRALSSHFMHSEIDFNENVNHTLFHTIPNTTRASSISGSGYSHIKDYTQEINKQNWEKMVEFGSEGTEIRIKSNINVVNAEEAVPKMIDAVSPDHSVTFQVQLSYIISQVKTGIVIIDQQAAHERILFDKFLIMLEKKFGASQQFLFPQTLELSHNDFDIVNELSEEIHALGFSFSVFGKNTIVINGIPADVRTGDEKNVFEGFIEQFRKNRQDLKINNRENLARSLAKKTSIKRGTKLNNTEIQAIVEQLFASTQPMYAPDGRKILVKIENEKLERMFES
ncbi:MAG: DNA mismatch repair endonuclease MutL [Cytophagales bacterium]|nr:DNA mismatch repair endonuclease MutL [Cytophagales bacterium]